MLVFHEGLPGAGKSYESMVHHILPAVIAGRDVITNIEGVNCKKLSELSGIPQRFVEQMVVCADFLDISDTEERLISQRDFILQNSKDDSLVVIDEIQDMFPSGRQKLESDHQKFFTEHRHHGLDIILMGQDLRDVHNIIRRRVHRKIVFTKLTALGANSKYMWAAYEATKAETFKKINSGTRSYEKKYFGLYSSHTGSTKNTSVYADDRTNIWKSPVFKWIIPLVLVIAYFSITHLFDFFTPKSTEQQDIKPVAVVAPPSNPETVIQNIKEPVQVDPQPLESSYAYEEAQPEEEADPLVFDTFEKDLRKWRPRLSGVVTGEGKIYATVEMLDSSLHAKDIYTSQAIESLGWKISFIAAGLIVEKGDNKALIRPWPVDPFGRSSSSHIRSL
jgi:zona occludens toxin